MKKYLSESDVRAKFITPTLIGAGWNEDFQIKREAPLTAGRNYVKGKLYARGQKKAPDYVLCYLEVLNNYVMSQFIQDSGLK